MNVIDHRPHTWYLLKEADRLYLHVRVNRSATEWSVTVQLTPQEVREYLAIGRLVIDYLAARIDSFTDEYTHRDLSRKLEGKVAKAIRDFQASKG